MVLGQLEKNNQWHELLLGVEGEVPVYHQELALESAACEFTCSLTT